jgi:hypothetical protein
VSRSCGPFVAINCCALHQALVRSELFGHVRGAFTGAVETRVGAFEAATNGTLFFDEVGELALEIQPSLLRVLETRQVQRVGDTATRKVDVRLISATHRSLEDSVSEDRFREDLCYRLMVVRLLVPPLRQRPSDIPDLVPFFSDDLQLPPLPEEVITQFTTRAWPGNVRCSGGAAGFGIDRHCATAVAPRHHAPHKGLTCEGRQSLLGDALSNDEIPTGIPTDPSMNINEARDWERGFVRWYNTAHRHSALNFVIRTTAIMVATRVSWLRGMASISERGSSGHTGGAPAVVLNSHQVITTDVAA